MPEKVAFGIEDLVSSYNKRQHLECCPAICLGCQGEERQDLEHLRCLWTEFLDEESLQFNLKVGVRLLLFFDLSFAH